MLREGETRVLVVNDFANVPAHQTGEQRVDKIEDTFMAAPVRGQVSSRAKFRGVPRLFVLAKNSRLSLAKSVNALLHVADQEPISSSSVARQGLDNSILRGIDILVFIDENPFQTRAPVFRDGRGVVAVPKQTQRELFEIVKIDESARELQFGILGGKLLGHCEQAHGDVAH